MPHADEAAARWRENISSVEEEVAAAASLEAAARAMAAEEAAVKP